MSRSKTSSPPSAPMACSETALLLLFVYFTGPHQPLNLHCRESKRKTFKAYISETKAHWTKETLLFSVYFLLTPFSLKFRTQVRPLLVSIV
jgi:hypothetical protein